MPGPEPGRTLLNPDQVERYARHLALPEVGPAGQRRLIDARVLVVGAGGLGSPAAIYLVAAGVGTIGIVDGDRVERSNLQRQILHLDRDVGRPKTQSARQHLEQLNPDVTVIEHPIYLKAANALPILDDYDLVVNGCDNFPTRYLLNDACVMLGKPLVDAAILRFDGQASVFLPGRGCYRCLFPQPPPPGAVPTCAEAGVIGALAGHMGTLQAMEAIKVLLGIGRPLASRLLLYDGLACEYRVIDWPRDPGCTVCGDSPTLTALIDYEAFCGGMTVPGEPTLVVSPRELSPEEVEDRLGRGELAVIDLRQPWELSALGAIPGSRNLPAASVEELASQLDPTRDTVLVCSLGRLSAELAARLQLAGYRRACNLRGGIVAWLNHRFPVQRPGA
ncbi:MAG TPA: molybdopterin-synthase adenylyltransferase MoeB [Bacillota bacterium]|nr:molybdopterin-synthase adenylyltransferase MoeB [Bacillota bacterium]